MLILASNSPRRREILASLGVAFTVQPSLFEERGEGLSPAETALVFARGKAKDVFSRNPHALVLGADTVVALDGQIFGKPKDEEDAARMLRALSGRTHSVLTGVCLLGEDFCSECVAETKVSFFALDEALIARYIREKRPLDKAGAYGIQDEFPLVRSYEGSYTNVVGLPAEKVREMLTAHGGKEC